MLKIRGVTIATLIANILTTVYFVIVLLARFARHRAALGAKAKPIDPNELYHALQKVIKSSLFPGQRWGYVLFGGCRILSAGR